GLAMCASSAGEILAATARTVGAVNFEVTFELAFLNDFDPPVWPKQVNRQAPLGSSPSCAWALPRSPQITAWLHLAAKPARPRLDEFLSGRCPDRIRCLRRLLSCRSGLAERSGRSGAYCWDAGWRHQPDSWRRACRCTAVEAS